MLSVISAEAQRVDYADTVKITKENVSSFVAAVTSTIPFEKSGLEGHFYFQYMYVYDIPVFAVHVENDGSELYHKLVKVADCLQNDYEKVLLAERNNSYAQVKEYDVTFWLTDFYVVSPRMSSSVCYTFFSKAWNNENESNEVVISIPCKSFVKRNDYKKELQERTLLEEDMNRIIVKYGDDEISIPLYCISTSKLISRCKKVIDK